MAHFAELDENNKVLRICVVDNAHVPSDMHVDGETWCENFWGGRWKQTSYNRTFRKTYATIGSTYDEERDAFIEPRPIGYDDKIFYSWILNETTCEWDPPVPYPEDGKIYIWDETNIKWTELIEESYE